MAMGLQQTAIFGGLSILTGCYSGLSVDAEELAGAAESAGTTAGPDGADGDSDGDDDEGERGSTCRVPDAGFNALRRLSRDEYANAVHDVFGVEMDVEDLPPDAFDGLFVANVVMLDATAVERYVKASESVVDPVATAFEAELECEVEAASKECVAEAVGRIGRRLHRRPLEPADLDAYVGVYEAAAEPREGLRQIAAAMLQSPWFLYKVETSASDDDIAPLDDLSLASRLSFLLWRSVPDDELLDVALAGDLHEPATLRSQAERMLADPKGRRGIVDFHRNWLEVNHLEHAEKADDLDVDASLRDSLARELDDLFEVASQPGVDWFQTLMTRSSTGVMDAELAAIYGVDPSTGAEETELPMERSGLLSRAGFVAAHSHPDQVSPVVLGYFIRTRMLCQAVPPPPEDIDATVPGADPSIPMRERFERHTEESSCAACHILMDGMGFAYEGYDAIGRFEPLLLGAPVDTSGDLVATDVDGPFEGPAELSEILAESGLARRCAADAWMAYGVQRQADPRDACARDSLEAVAMSAEGDVPSMLLAIIESDAFTYRRASADLQHPKDPS